MRSLDDVVVAVGHAVDGYSLAGVRIEAPMVILFGETRYGYSLVFHFAEAFILNLKKIS
jgi:hypothetical protein